MRRLPGREFLQSDDVIDCDHPDIIATAQELQSQSGDSQDAVLTARRCFEFVRDEIAHTGDGGGGPLTCRASDVLRHRTGFCYAKSHLLCGLLRANEIPAGLCYQRLCVDHSATQYCLHGFNAVWLPEIGWYRIDPRGNRSDITAQFTPPDEVLAFSATHADECTFPDVLPRPLPIVVQALRSAETWDEFAGDLPDLSERSLVSGTDEEAAAL